MASTFLNLMDTERHCFNNTSAAQPFFVFIHKGINVLVCCSFSKLRLLAPVDGMA